MYVQNATHFIQANKKSWILPDVLINSVKNTVKNKLIKFRQSLVFTGFWLISTYSFPVYSFDCISDQIDEYAVVKQVYDGDTVKLTNGKKVRLIGINTPEINYKTGNPEPYAKKAKYFLQQKVLKQKIGLRFGNDKKDRHGRFLAHIFLRDKINLQQALLKNGLAVNIAIPPNLWQQDCYLNAEKEARRLRKGIWENHNQNIIDAQQIKSAQTGFQFVKGTVMEINEDKKTIWLKLSNKMSLRIFKKNLVYFNNMNIKRLKNKRIIARGWVNRYKKRYHITIGHPNALQLL